MISLETIEREIDELESRDTTYKLCERLAWLYVVRDHLVAKLPAKQGHIVDMRGSEFLEAASGTGINDLMQVLDEHMAAVKVVHPREYDAVMAKIRALRYK